MRTHCYHQLFLVILCLSIGTSLSSQTNKAYFIKDFLFQDDVYRLQAGREDKLHQFTVSLGSEQQEFNLTDLKDQYIFYKKLTSAISTVHSAKKEQFLLKSTALNDSLSLIQLSIIQDTAFILSKKIKNHLTTLITDLANLKGCDSVFLNRAKIDTVLDLANNKTVALFFNKLKDDCQQSSIFVSESNNEELLKISMNLFTGILRNSMVDKEDASLAGRLVVFYDSIKACVEKKSDTPEDTSGSSDSSRDLANNDSSAVNNPRYQKYKRKIKSETAKTISIFGDDEKCKNSNLETFVIDSVQFEFEADKLLNIKAIGHIGDKIEIFENVYPVSFSTKRDGNNEHTLFSALNIDGNKRIIKSKHLFYFDYNLLLYTENYAPKDQVLYIKPSTSGKVLFKERNSEILKTKVFTDLVGLNDDDPNGLLQLEFSKPINLWTKVKPIGTFSTAYSSCFSQIEPVFTLNKIEDDDNELEVLRLENSAFVSYNDVVRYRKASIGFNIRVFSIGIPSFHSTLSLKYSHHYSIVPIADRDSTNQTFPIINNPDSLLVRVVNNHLTRELGPSIEWEIFPSDKYQLSLMYTLNRFRFYSNDENESITPYEDKVVLQADPQKVIENNAGQEKTYHSFQLLATVRLSKRGELFFRSRYHFLDKNPEQNFFQNQLGYSYFFFSGNN